jgi:hypothetical protein
MARFSQRYGYTSAKRVFQREEVSSELRVALWNTLSLCIWDRWEVFDYGWSEQSTRINALLKRIWIHHLNADLDQLSPLHYRDSRPGTYDVLKRHFMSAKWYQVLDFVEFLVQDSDSFITNDVTRVLNQTLEKENSSYRIVAREVTEITDQNQIAAIEMGLEASPPPVKAHIATALAMLSDRTEPDFRNSIKESISAVEAACREVANLPKATLGDALKELPDIHPALQKAFSNLYGYTNDADGIRHALLSEPNLKKEDATFMLVVCSAFIGYLYEKASR